ncbi:sodium-dependent transporter [Pseudogracilibacillus auburnensis]|uniref:Transporter n=1 Tax=Pseudogracilibacillus auburnensis TaxID=1494959 RepID=A0A2V3VXB1_9BACI|nr:sodium-dependent transporter [Pseudogracilibacillus auburnensis]MBO1002390.1 sodium-dependent transporter [Pseudogracilibacillus auburnensis]PXW86220.1 NSS family neurotransmitter:Na+ symporter [Pseudogracilibacillus auburnensis]
MEEKRDQWTSKIGFILASAGAAIGLGAIWKFPYVTGMSGGGAFFLIFVIFTLLIGLPMLISEFIIGRGTAKEAVSAYKKLAPESLWVWIGRLGVLGCFLLLTFYSVVGGWVLVYSAMSIPGKIIADSANYEALFGSVVGSPGTTMLGLLLFTIINVLVISMGIKNGIEKANKYMMPLLFVFFIILVIRSLTLEGAMEGVTFFLSPDFSNITRESLLYALGQSFFSLAVGFSCMVTYSSYLKRDVNLTSSAGTVVGMNIFVSLLAGLAIFPVVFALGFEPAEGPGLLFIVLPAAFAQLPFGALFLSLFLLLFLFATLTSSFSLYEIIVAALTANGKLSRKAVTWILGAVLMVVAIPSALSSSSMSGIEIFGKSIFDATDFLVSNIMLPLGSLLIAIFIIHRADKALVKEEFHLGGKEIGSMYPVWRLLMTWIVPATIIIVFLNTLGVVR